MIQQITQPVAAARAAPASTRSAFAVTDFANVFADQLRSAQDIKFSAHATQRLRDRNLTITSDDKKQIQHGLNLAASKGSRETLLLTDRLALVASVPNWTVITAMPRSNAGDAVFTNIDSTVVVGA